MCEPSPSPGRITTGEFFTLHMHGYSQLYKLSERLHTKHLDAGRNPPLLQFSKLHRNHQIHWSPKPKPTRDPRSTDGGSQAWPWCHTFFTHTSVDAIAPSRRSNPPPSNLLNSRCACLTAALSACWRARTALTILSYSVLSLDKTVSMCLATAQRTSSS